MFDAMEEHDRKVSVCCRNVTNQRFADDIDALAKKTCTRYKMEISAEKSKSKQHQWQRGTGQGNGADAGYKLQVPRSNCVR